jgi:hypothetical protein
LKAEFEKAEAQYRELLEDSPQRPGKRARIPAGNMDWKALMGMSAAHAGHHDEARRVLDELRYNDDPYLFGCNTFHAAWVAAHLGELDLAVALLYQAFASGRMYNQEFHRSVGLEPLRDYPPYQELMRPKG